VHLVQACYEEQEVLVDQFEAFKANIEILDTGIQTDKQRVNMERAGVGSQMQLQEVVLQDIRSEVNILQAQNNHIVQEANVLFKAHKSELEATSKRVTNCDGQILSIKGTNIGIQRSLKEMNWKIIRVNEILNSIKNSLKESLARGR